MKILVVEDDVQTAETLKSGLEESYQVDLAHTGEKGESLASENDYDVILLDIKLPGSDGILVCKNLRSFGVLSPIIMLTGQIDESTIVKALDTGADDYIKKPFSFSELKARIRAVLRREPNSAYFDELKLDNLILDPAGRTVKRDGKKITLRRKEFDILELLMRNENRVISQDRLLMKVWDTSSPPSTNTVSVHINSLRNKVDRDFENKLIKTVHGNGYKISK